MSIAFEYLTNDIASPTTKMASMTFKKNTIKDYNTTLLITIIFFCGYSPCLITN